MARHPTAIPWPLVLMTGFLIMTLLTLAVIDLRAAGLMAAIPVGCWILVIVAESVRLAGLTPGALRIALAFFMIYLGLVLGFWRGIPEFRRFRSSASP